MFIRLLPMSPNAFAPPFPAQNVCRNCVLVIRLSQRAVIHRLHDRIRSDDILSLTVSDHHGCVA